MSRYGSEINKYLKKVQNGDMVQLGKVFDLTANHLRVIALKYLNNKTYCEDVVSDVFCKVIHYIHTFNPHKDGYNWLCKITERVAYSYNEIENESRNNTISIEKATNVGAETNNIDEHLEMLMAMGNLTETDKNIVYDYFYLNLTYENIAAKYGVVKSAIHKRIKKSFKIIKEYLQRGEQKD